MSGTHANRERTKSSRTARGRALGPVLVLALIAGSACDGTPTEQLLARNAMEVTSVDPERGAQGETLEVSIHGTGFAEDATVRWERDGTVAEQIVVHTVAFIDETELIATVTIGVDAVPDLYDVSVSRKRKKGIGSEDIVAVGTDLFEVYTPVALGWLPHPTMDGPQTQGNAINDHGVIAGVDGTFSGGEEMAIRWAESDGFARIGGPPSYAYAINNEGWIVGVHGRRETFVNVDAFVYHDGQMIDLEPPVAGKPTKAADINDSGTIVGHTYKYYNWDAGSWGASYALVWKRDEEGGYGLPHELSGRYARAVNDRGDVVGRVGRSEVGLWKVQPDGTYSEPIRLGGGDRTSAFDINDSGWIAGWIRHGEEPTQAVVWHPNDYANPIVLPQQPLGGAAYAINNELEVVGMRRTNQIAESRGGAAPETEGTFWRLDNAGNTIAVIRLRAADGYSHSTASDINDDGWVVGNSRRYPDYYYESEATLWRPDR